MNSLGENERYGLVIVVAAAGLKTTEVLTTFYRTYVQSFKTPTLSDGGVIRVYLSHFM